MADSKREELIKKIHDRRMLDSSLQPDTCLSDGWIADDILAREQAMLSEIEKPLKNMCSNKYNPDLNEALATITRLRGNPDLKGER